MSEPTTKPNPPANPTPRADGRSPESLRPIRFENDIAPNAAGSTLVHWGNTRVICAVTIEDVVPRWMKEQGVAGGWLTAEYSMLPYSTSDRKARDITRGRLDGRSSEIQRLIGRSLRAAVDLSRLGTRTLWIDCDVLQADGGTRTAAITGAWVALKRALRGLLAQGLLTTDPVVEQVGAVSIGVVDGRPLLDLCYTEDAAAAVDMNLVMTGSGRFIEVQGSGEEATFTGAELEAMLALGRGGISKLLELQKAALAQD
jgi:ribonuclease PH